MRVYGFLEEVRFSHPLLLMSRKANKINAFRLFCSLLTSFRILPANNNLLEYQNII